tara:strand:- start:73 stop:708 length:636 start_codon:yes stop_codon:yes gene_type:complete
MSSEIEVAGVKFKGGKIVIILTALGSIGGALWTAFVFYQDYLNLVDKVKNFESPNLDFFQEQLSVTEEKINSLTLQLNEKVESLDKQVQVNLKSINVELRTINELVQAAAKDAREVRTDLRADMTLVEKQISEVDKRSRENVKDTATSIRNSESNIRSLINEAETRFGEKRNLIEQDSSRRAESFSKLLIDLETRFDTKLERALTNPLAGK